VVFSLVAIVIKATDDDPPTSRRQGHRAHRSENRESPRLEETSLSDRRHADSLPVDVGDNMIWETTRPLACLELQLGNQQAVLVRDAASACCVRPRPVGRGITGQFVTSQRSRKAASDAAFK
jgi:hypothetical protein